LSVSSAESGFRWSGLSFNLKRERRPFFFALRQRRPKFFSQPVFLIATPPLMDYERATSPMRPTSKSKSQKDGCAPHFPFLPFTGIQIRPKNSTLLPSTAPIPEQNTMTASRLFLFFFFNLDSVLTEFPLSDLPRDGSPFSSHQRPLFF